jgi:hypothetical protein
MGLKRFEERLERLVEGSLSRPFRSSLQPVEIGRRLTREMDLARRVGPRGQLVCPNSFRITLSPDDIDRFESYIDALAKELAETARQHAHLEGYALLGPVEVDLFESSSVKAGQLAVQAEVLEGAEVCDLVLTDGQRIRLSDRPIVLGRQPDCDVVLDDSNVSRRHAEIVVRDGEVVLSDLGSTNGTKVNGASVRSCVLRIGDAVQIGLSRMLIEGA